MAPTISHQHIAFERGLVLKNRKTCTISWYDKRITTTVTSNPFAVCGWIEKIETIHGGKIQGLIVGVHVQTYDNTVTKKSSIATLQLCVENQCLVFQICHAKFLKPAIREFLNNKNYVFVGVGVKETLAKVVDHNRKNNKIVGIDVKSVDLSWLAAKVYELDFMKNLGLKDLARLTMKAKLLKPTLKAESKWDDECLSDAQVLVAALDAIVSYQIGFRLKASSLFTFVAPLAAEKTAFVVVEDLLKEVNDKEEETEWK